MSRHSVFFDIEDALPKPGCMLCRLTTTSVLQYFKSLGYEQVNDIEARDELRRDGGFCPRHAWLFWERSGNRLGVAIIYRDVLNHEASGLKQGRPSSVSGGLGGRLGRLFSGGSAAQAAAPAPRPCSACRYESDAEARYRSTFVEQLHAADLRALYAASDGLCLPHLERTLAAGGRREDLTWLRQDAGRRLATLVGELDEYIRKHDYRFRHEGFGSEEDSPRRAVQRAVGQAEEGL